MLQECTPDRPVMPLTGGFVSEAQLLCEGDCNPGWRLVKAQVRDDPMVIRSQSYTRHTHVSHITYRCTVCGSLRQWGW